jgi:hypothetical protein
MNPPNHFKKLFNKLMDRDNHSKTTAKIKNRLKTGHSCNIIEALTFNKDAS